MEKDAVDLEMMLEGKKNWFLPFNMLQSEANSVQFQIWQKLSKKVWVSGNSYVKYDQRFLYYLGLLITKKVILNSIVGVSLNEYNKRHTVVVAEKSVLKMFL